MVVSTVINFCSNEYRFINHAIDQALRVSDQVIVPVCTHFFGGEPENMALIRDVYKTNPKAQFIEYPYVPAFRKKYGPHFWHNIGRYLGYLYTRDICEFILFLDADEIIDGDRFKHWMSHYPLEKYDGLRLEGYWYFRDASYQALTTENAGLLSRKSTLTYAHFFSDSERTGQNDVPRSIENVKDTNNEPLIHHYSWVRTKEEMLKKVKNWGHTSDRANWVDLVEEEFTRPFSGKDFVHGYEYRTVQPFVPISLKNQVSATINDQAFSNVIYLSEFQLRSVLQKSFDFRKLFS